MRQFMMRRSNDSFVSGKAKTTSQLRQVRLGLCVWAPGCILVGAILAIRTHSMKLSIESLAWTVGWWIFSILFIALLLTKIIFHSRLARTGVLLSGVLKKSTVTDSGVDGSFELEVEYSFVTPDGVTIVAKAKGSRVGSNYRDLTPVGYSQYNRGEIGVSVLYVNRESFILL
jgi:hypothetical protein